MRGASSGGDGGGGAASSGTDGKRSDGTPSVRMDGTAPSLFVDAVLRPKSRAVVSLGLRCDDIAA